jgi:hypothetical protein
MVGLVEWEGLDSVEARREEEVDCGLDILQEVSADPSMLHYRLLYSTPSPRLEFSRTFYEPGLCSTIFNMNNSIPAAIPELVCASGSVHETIEYSRRFSGLLVTLPIRRQV